MNILSCALLIPLAVGPSISCAQTTPKAAQQKPAELTVCEILKNPSSLNDTIVKVSAVVRVSAEYSILEDRGCPEEGIWFMFGDGSAPPGMIATVNSGASSSNSQNSKKRSKSRVPIHLVKDSNYQQLLRYLATSAKNESCAENPLPTLPPDCRSYKIIATFIGRIDSVSKEIRAAHLKRTSRDGLDGKGFGHMGMFDVQLIVKSVENVSAE